MTRLLLILFALVGSAFAQTAAFLPSGPTVNLVVTGTAQNLVLPTATIAGANASQLAALSQNMILTNVGTQTVFYRFDGTTATVSNAMPLLANSQVVISVPRAGATASVIAATTGSTLYATVGLGQ